MKNLKSEPKQSWHIGILLLRIFVGSRLLYGVVDNLTSWDKMLEFSSFLESNGFPIPLASAIVSVAVQFVCGLFVLIGFKIKWASILLILNFVVALLFFHLRIGDSVEGMTPAVAMLFGSLTFVFTGAGRFSIGGRMTNSNS